MRNQKLNAYNNSTNPIMKQPETIETRNARDGHHRPLAIATYPMTKFREKQCQANK